MDASLLAHIDAMPSPEEWRRQRLASVVQRVHRHGAFAQFGAEIELAERLLQLPATAQAAEFCLLALERGLDLFDVRKEIEPIMRRDHAQQEGRRLGGLNKPSKLPPVDRLQAELRQLMAARGICEGAAKTVLASRYHVSEQAVRKALRKTKQADLSSTRGDNINTSTAT